VHQQVRVIAFTVELLQLCFKVAGDVPHDLFAAFQHLGREHSAPVSGNKHQVDAEVMDDVC
jgi:hypothetical protein